MAAEKLPWPVVIYMICVIVPVGFHLGPLALTLLRGFLLIMVLPLFFQLVTGKLGRLYATDILFFLHLGWMIVALSANNPSQMVQQVGSLGIEFLGAYLVGRAYIRSRESFIALCKILVLLVFASIPFALFETLTGRPIIVEAIRRLPPLTSVPIVSIDPRMGLERVQFTFAHPIHYGLFCSVVFSLCFVALDGVYTRTRRLISSLIIALSGFLALSSGALLAMVLQFILIAWYLTFARIEWRWWLLVGLCAFAYVVIDLLSNRTPLRVFMSYATFSAHNAYWRGIIFEWGIKNVLGDAANNIPASPWVGIGLNDWIRPWYMHSGSMDNFWLVIIVRYGFPGFLALALGYIWAIAQIMRRDFSNDVTMANIRRAWVFTFLGLSFTLSTVHVWTNVYSFVFFMFGAGMWIIAERGDGPSRPAGPDAAPPRNDSARAAHTRFPEVRSRRHAR